MARQLSQEEITVFRELFDSYDPDRSGNITVEEFAQVMCVKPGKKPTEAEVQQIIKEVDLDGDGTINFAEFITMMTGTPYAPPSEVTVTSAEKADGSEAAAKDGEELEA